MTDDLLEQCFAQWIHRPTRCIVMSGNCFGIFRNYDCICK